MGGTGQHGISPRSAAGQVFRVEVCECDAECLGRASDLVQRKQRAVTIERGVFQTFRHDRAGELLKAHDEEAPLGTVGFADTVRVFEQ